MSSSLFSEWPKLKKSSRRVNISALCSVPDQTGATEDKVRNQMWRVHNNNNNRRWWRRWSCSYTEEVIKPLSAPSDLDQTLFGEGAWRPLRVEEEEEELVELEECWAQWGSSPPHRRLRPRRSPPARSDTFHLWCFSWGRSSWCFSWGSPSWSWSWRLRWRLQWWARSFERWKMENRRLLLLQLLHKQWHLFWDSHQSNIDLMSIEKMIGVIRS